MKNTKDRVYTLPDNRKKWSTDHMIRQLKKMGAVDLAESMKICAVAFDNFEPSGFAKIIEGQHKRLACYQTHKMKTFADNRLLVLLNNAIQQLKMALVNKSHSWQVPVGFVKEATRMVAQLADEHKIPRIQRACDTLNFLTSNDRVCRQSEGARGLSFWVSRLPVEGVTKVLEELREEINESDTGFESGTSSLSMSAA